MAVHLPNCKPVAFVRRKSALAFTRPVNKIVSKFWIQSKRKARHQDPGAARSTAAACKNRAHGLVSDL
jgi:hypothetical protein